MSKDAEHIIKLIAKYFDVPCQYEYGDVDSFTFIDTMDNENGIGWCEEHCGEVTCYDCWFRFLSLAAKCENEQLENGKEQNEC